MRMTVEHLPEEKRFEINRIAEIIREVVNPEKILVFGSYAKGTYVEDRYRAKDGITYEYISDYDFLVVTSGNAEKTYSQEARIMDRVDRFNPPVNLEIHEITYINRGLEWEQYFFTEITSQGILLFDTGNVHFIEPKVLTSEEEKERAKEYFNLWFPRNIGFMKSARFCLVENELKTGVFNLHQATESLYYALLLVFTGYKPKTHNLWKLRKKTMVYSEELFSVFLAEVDKQEEHLFDLLKRGYVEARYSQDYVITKEELSTLIERVTIMADLVRKICSVKI